MGIDPRKNEPFRYDSGRSPSRRVLVLVFLAAAAVLGALQLVFKLPGTDPVIDSASDRLEFSGGSTAARRTSETGNSGPVKFSTESMNPPPESADLPLQAPREGVLIVRVLLDDNSPVEKVPIEVYVGSVNGAVDLICSGDTNHAGEAVFEGMSLLADRAGTLHAGPASALGFGDPRVVDGDLRGNQPVIMTYKLARAGQLRVEAPTFFSAGVPAGLSLRLRARSANGRRSAIEVQLHQGSATLRHLAPNQDFVLEFVLAGDTWTEPLLVEGPLVPGETKELAGSSFRFRPLGKLRFVDNSGVTLAKTAIQSAQWLIPNAPFLELDCRVSPDPVGNFWTILPPPFLDQSTGNEQGTLFLRYSATQGGRELEGSRAVSADKSIIPQDLGVFVLHETEELLSGQITSPDGQGLPSLTYYITHDPDTAQQSGCPCRLTHEVVFCTGADGELGVWGTCVAPTLLVRVYTPQIMGSWLVQNGTRNLRLQTTKRHGFGGHILTDRELDASTVFFVHVRRDTGSGVSHQAHQALFEAPGVFRFAITLDHGDPVSVDLTLSEADELVYGPIDMVGSSAGDDRNQQDLVLDLRGRVRTVRLEIRDPDGRSLQELSVKTRSFRQEWMLRGRTGPEGQVRFQTLAADLYVLIEDRDGHTSEHHIGTGDQLIIFSR